MDASSPDRLKHFEEALALRAETHRLRSIEHFSPSTDGVHVEREGRRFLNFSSNDYLGFSTDPDIIEGAVRTTRIHGVGAGASRLVTGGLDLHDALEHELAEFTNRESALLFGSGFQANATVIPALVARNSHVFCDRRAHNSIFQGAVLSRAKLRRFRHNDPEHLHDLLAAAGGTGDVPALVVTESVFSMDGDRARLQEIAEVVDRFGALLMVDDAHAFGILGPGGRGIAAAHPRVDIVLGTFGKALGTFGAFVATHATLRDYFVNYCAGFIYSTAPPPTTLGAVHAGLDKIRSESVDLEAYHAFVGSTHLRLRASGWDTSPSDTQILPISMPDEEAAIDAAGFLRERGILVVPIRPPTVPEGGTRIRISLSRLHSNEDVDRLIDALDSWRTSR